MRAMKLTYWTIALLPFVAVLFTNPLSATSAQVGYTYATHQDESNRHFVVEITSTSNVVLLCQIQYSGLAFQDMEHSGKRILPVRAVGANGKPVVAATHFEGFRTFTATVNCTAK